MGLVELVISCFEAGEPQGVESGLHRYAGAQPPSLFSEPAHELEP